jgi:hypothetical protein
VRASAKKHLREKAVTGLRVMSDTLPLILSIITRSIEPMR